MNNCFFFMQFFWITKQLLVHHLNIMDSLFFQGKASVRSEKFAMMLKEESKQVECYNLIDWLIDWSIYYICLTLLTFRILRCKKVGTEAKNDVKLSKPTQNQRKKSRRWQVYFFFGCRRFFLFFQLIFIYAYLWI